MVARSKAHKLPHDKVQEVLDYQATRDRRRSYPSKNEKGLVSVRIDQDVIDYFKGTGGRWQSRINSVLRQASGIDDLPSTADDHRDL